MKAKRKKSLCDIKDEAAATDMQARMAALQLADALKVEDAKMQPRYVWDLNHRLFDTLDTVKASIALKYADWAIKPVIELEREDYVAWRVPDGSLIEAYRDEINTVPLENF